MAREPAGSDTIQTDPGGAGVLVHDDSLLGTDFSSWAAIRLPAGSVVTPAEAVTRGLTGREQLGPDVPTRWVEGDTVFRGPAAVARSLRDMGGLWAPVGSVLTWPVVASLFAVGYRIATWERAHDADAFAEREVVAGSWWRRAVGSTPATDTFVTVVVLVAVGVVARFDHKIGRPSSQAFEHASVLIGMVATKSKAVVPLVVGALCLVVRRRLTWADLYDGRRTRWIVMVSAASLAVTASLYQPNYFFGRTYLVDRLLVLALLALIWFRPAAAVLFAVFVVVASAQFDYPIGGFTWTHKDLLVNVVLLFGILVTCGGGRTARTMRCFFTGTCVLFICYYFAAWGTKMVFGWPWRENLGFLAAGTHANGWLPGQIGETVADVTSHLRLVVIPGTLLVEFGSCFLLAGRRAAKVVLPLLVALHLCIFLTSGINFLTSWGVLLIALWIYVMRGRGFGRARLPLVASTLVLVLVAPWLFGTYRLAWLDTAYSFQYQLVAVGESGTQYRVDLGDMAPYDFAFTHNFFSYISDVPTVDTYSWGSTTSRALSDAMLRAKSPADVAAVQARFGRSRYDPEMAAEFDTLVRARFRRPPTELPNHVIHEIWSGAPPVTPGSSARAVYTGQEPITKVYVRLVEVWWNGHSTQILTTCTVREISVSGAPTRIPDHSACTLGNPSH